MQTATNLATTSLASDYPLLNLFWTTCIIFLWILWFMLLFRIIADIFRDDDLGGGGKTGWCIFVVLLPFLGVFVYLIARGTGMGKRELAHVQKQQAEFREYVRETAAPTGSTADELAKLSDLKARGTITEEEYAAAKAKILA
ncbi:SHOCT domain-containing protein [Kitasatospora sp. NPDC097643]|uniref:SHOCT domain-containing protein n=1 Tax=Kitasatospora sp. NPDC097643 TaxID=3157230 RepID=UPI00332092CF